MVPETSSRHSASRAIMARAESLTALGAMPSAQLIVLSAAAFDDAVRDHFQNAMGHLDEKKARFDLGEMRSAGHHAFVSPPPGGGRGGCSRAESLSKSDQTKLGAIRRRRLQWPGLGRAPAGPSDRRFRLAETSVGGLLPLRPGVRVPLETSRNGVRSARWRGASGSASTFAIQPSRGVRDCMAATKHQTAYRTVKALP